MTSALLLLAAPGPHRETMTNLHLAILSTVLTLAIGAAYWAHRKHLERCLITFGEVIGQRFEQHERSLRSHVVDEIDNLEHKVVSNVKNEANNLFMDVSSRVGKTEDAVIGFVKEHADDLRKHAAEIKAHSIEIHDRAVSRDIAPRQAVTRT